MQHVSSQQAGFMYAVKVLFQDESTMFQLAFGLRQEGDSTRGFKSKMDFTM